MLGGAGDAQGGIAVSQAPGPASYWRRNLLVVGVLLAIWFGVTFGVAFYARELGSIDFFGWPFSYWVGAQGALIVYVAIIVLYARYMNRLDRQIAPERPAGEDHNVSQPRPGHPESGQDQ